MKLILLYIFSFIIGIASVFAFRVWQVKKETNTPFVPQKSSFALQPPSQALTGRVIGVKGEVKKEPRDKEELAEVKRDEKVVDGDKLVTEKKSQAVIKFADFGLVTLGSNSEVSLINLLPSNFLVKQASGRVEYQVIGDQNPISVRSLHVLFALEEGKSIVTTNGKEGEIVIELLVGKGKIAIVDLENETRVWQIKAGEKATIDDGRRTAEVVRK